MADKLFSELSLNIIDNCVTIPMHCYLYVVYHLATSSIKSQNATETMEWMMDGGREATREGFNCCGDAHAVMEKKCAFLHDIVHVYVTVLFNMLLRLNIQ